MLKAITKYNSQIYFFYISIKHVKSVYTSPQENYTHTYTRWVIEAWVILVCVCSNKVTVQKVEKRLKEILFKIRCLAKKSI